MKASAAALMACRLTSPMRASSTHEEANKDCARAECTHRTASGTTMIRRRVLMGWELYFAVTHSTRFELRGTAAPTPATAPSPPARSYGTAREGWRGGRAPER